MRPAVTGAVANSDDLIFGPPFIARTFALIGHRAPAARPIANGFPVRHMRSPPRFASRRTSDDCPRVYVSCGENRAPPLARREAEIRDAASRGRGGKDDNITVDGGGL